MLNPTHLVRQTPGRRNGYFTDDVPSVGSDMNDPTFDPAGRATPVIHSYPRYRRNFSNLALPPPSPSEFEDIQSEIEDFIEEPEDPVDPYHGIPLMRYDEDRFVETVPEDFFCHFCQNLSSRTFNPLCNKRDVICYQCLLIPISERQKCYFGCQNGSWEVEKNPNDLLLLDFTYKCKFHTHGCKESCKLVEYSKLVEHEEICSHNPKSDNGVNEIREQILHLNSMLNGQKERTTERLEQLQQGMEYLTHTISDFSAALQRNHSCESDGGQQRILAGKIPEFKVPTVSRKKSKHVFKMRSQQSTVFNSTELQIMDLKLKMYLSADEMIPQYGVKQTVAGLAREIAALFQNQPNCRPKLFSQIYRYLQRMKYNCID